MIGLARYKARIAKVREIMHRHRVDAMLLSNPVSVRYCCGFTGEDSFVLLSRRSAILLTDGRFVEQARIETQGVEIIIRQERVIPAIAKIIKRRKIHKIGIEADNLTVAFRNQLASTVKPVRIKPLEGVVSGLRQVKDVEEISAIRASIRVAEDAFRALIPKGAKGFIGKTEQQIAAELEYLMRQGGAERAAFETIVARGAHAALPHYRPGGVEGKGSQVKIRAGDAVLIDWGAVVNGYCSDLTRMVFIGKIPRQIGKLYEVVLSAQQSACESVRAGVSVGFVDAAARDVISKAGYAKAFTHGIGHGIGLEIHELPHLGRGMEHQLTEGMVITIEPGIYLPRMGGVRIEDDYIVCKDGAKRLTTLTRDAEEMILV